MFFTPGSKLHAALHRMGHHLGGDVDRHVVHPRPRAAAATSAGAQRGHLAAWRGSPAPRRTPLADLRLACGAGNRSPILFPSSPAPRPAPSTPPRWPAAPTSFRPRRAPHRARCGAACTRSRCTAPTRSSVRAQRRALAHAAVLGWVLARWRRTRARARCWTTPRWHKLLSRWCRWCACPADPPAATCRRWRSRRRATARASTSPSTSGDTIRPWVRSQRRAVRDRITHEHLLASAAIPFVFPATAIDMRGRTEYFGDGSMRQSPPSRRPSTWAPSACWWSARAACTSPRRPRTPGHAHPATRRWRRSRATRCPTSSWMRWRSTWSACSASTTRCR
jgi:NTE family protein